MGGTSPGITLKVNVQTETLSASQSGVTSNISKLDGKTGETDFRMRCHKTSNNLCMHSTN